MPDADLTFRVGLKVNQMPKTNLLQNAVYESIDRKWYLCQAQDAGARDREHSMIRRFSRTGTFEGTTKCELFGHGNQIGVRKSAAGNVWIWVPMDSYNGSGHTTSTKPARVVFEKGSTRVRKESAVVDIYDGGLANQGFGLSAENPGILYLRKGHSGSETYRMVDEEAYRKGNGKSKVYGEVEVSKHNRGKYFQGCGAGGDTLAVLSGSTGHNQYIDVYSFEKRKKLTRLTIPISQIYRCLKSGGATYSSAEAEGLQFIDGALYMGARSGPPGKKRDFSIMEVSGW
jgi:hypothetical protein